MLIATFGPTTAWVGTRITHEGGSFMLEGHGPISAADIMEYDRQGHLLWVDAGTRAWVGSKAQASAAARRVTAAPARETSEARDAAKDPGSQAATRPRSRLKLALWVA